MTKSDFVRSHGYYHRHKSYLCLLYKSFRQDFINKNSYTVTPSDISYMAILKSTITINPILLKYISDDDEKLLLGTYSTLGRKFKVSQRTSLDLYFSTFNMF